MRFATWLRESRESKGMSRLELAKTLGLHDATIKNYEYGYSFPDDEILDKMASVFGGKF